VRGAVSRRSKAMIAGGKKNIDSNLEIIQFVCTQLPLSYFGAYASLVSLEPLPEPAVFVDSEGSGHELCVVSHVSLGRRI
jgi:hypothetical protein